MWDSFFVKLEIESTINCRDVLREIIITSGNRLSLKIWFQLAAYDGDRLNRNSTEEEKLIIQTMLKSMQLGYEKEALKAYEQWMNTEQGI
ncbi:hypothetical protein ABH968_003720 [Lysinibacillus sp. RC79]